MKKYLLLLITVVLTGIAGQAQTYGDYTLYVPKNSTKTYLIDMSGAIAHTWTAASSKPNGYSAYLLPGGVLLRTIARQGNSFTGGPICGEVQKVDWNGSVIWDYVYSTTGYCTHHDICPMPNGNVLLIAYEAKNSTQVQAAGCSQNITMWPDKIVEIQPVGASGGNVVWEWHTWDHLCQSLYPAKANYVTSILDHPELFNINYLTQKDWQHVNGIDYNARLDQIAFSSHNFNELYVIDHSTTTAEAASHSGGNSGMGGDILYRWGNPLAYQASGTVNFNVVHDAHWVPYDCPKAGYLAGFNNKGGTGGKTCIDLVTPPYDGYNYNHTPGTAFEPATYTWRHTYSGSPTQNEGNSQQLPNGNMLINISFSGYIYEIDSNQNVVWSKSTAGTNTSAFRYTSCYVNSIGYADATAVPPLLCQGSSSQLNASGIGGTGYTYSWTSIPPGFTSNLQSPLVTPDVTTAYYVTITSGSCSASDSVKINVDPVPDQPVIAMQNDTLFSSSEVNNQWYRNGDLITGATLLYYVPQTPGSYQVEVIDPSGCSSLLSDPYLYTSLEEFEDVSIQIYREPGTDFLVVKGIECSILDLFWMNGKVIRLDVLDGKADISQLAPGVYLARPLKEGRGTGRKILISR